MELRQLRYLEAVARHRHFTRAAEELHVAQSALSAQVRRLENELGVELLRRTTRSVELTEAGEMAVARARAALAEADALREGVDEMRGLVRGTVSIGALIAAGEIDVPASSSASTGRIPASTSSSAKEPRRRCTTISGAASWTRLSRSNGAPLPQISSAGRSPPRSWSSR